MNEGQAVWEVAEAFAKAGMKAQQATDLVLKEEKAKEAGIAKSAAKNSKFVEAARIVADRLGAVMDDISIDDVRQFMDDPAFMEKVGLAELGPVVWGNWAGSVFKEEKWEFVGMTRCDHKGGHRRKVSRWRLR